MRFKKFRKCNVCNKIIDANTERYIHITEVGLNQKVYSENYHKICYFNYKGLTNIEVKQKIINLKRKLIEEISKFGE